MLDSRPHGWFLARSFVCAYYRVSVYTSGTGVHIWDFVETLSQGQVEPMSGPFTTDRRFPGWVFRSPSGMFLRLLRCHQVYTPVSGLQTIETWE